MAANGHTRAIAEPALTPQLLERVLGKLGLRRKPSVDLTGLNMFYAAFCEKVPFDNVQKRIWFASDHTVPLPGGNPAEFFENWLAHGTGGTCWPINGGLYSLLRALGFDARRIVGSVIVEGYPQGANHGSILVSIDRVEHVADGWMSSFKALPVKPGLSTSTGDGIHDIRAVPTESGHELLCYAGWNREQPLPFRPEPEYDPVDHDFWLARYDRTKKVGFFNDALFICRHFSRSILTVGRMNKICVAADGSLTKTQLTEAGRKAVLIQELGLSEAIVERLPADVPDGFSPV